MTIPLPLTQTCGCQQGAGHQCRVPWMTESEWNPPVSYAEFLREKVSFNREFGFDITDTDIHPALKPHQRAIVDEPEPVSA